MQHTRQGQRPEGSKDIGKQKHKNRIIPVEKRSAACVYMNGDLCVCGGTANPGSSCSPLCETINKQREHDAGPIRVSTFQTGMASRYMPVGGMASPKAGRNFKVDIRVE